mmetsp:Transcript_92045/g.257280  ORF Transcript_92045/g.257280 Transcript_92045/m.257280 type:complete len:281 (-) Transcript_92045:25-867(-)
MHRVLAGGRCSEDPYQHPSEHGLGEQGCCQAGQCQLQGTIHLRGVCRWEPGVPERSQGIGLRWTRPHRAMEGLVRNGAARGLRGRMALLRGGAHHDRHRHCDHRRPRRAARLRRRHAAGGHGHHARRRGDLPPGHLRVKDLGDHGPLRRQQHRQRHGQQLRQCLPRPRAALDDRGRLLGGCGRLRAGRSVEPQIPGAGCPVSRWHLRCEGWQLGVQRGDLHSLRDRLHRDTTSSPALLGRRTGRSQSLGVVDGRLLRDPLGGLPCSVHRVGRELSEPSTA